MLIAARDIVRRLPGADEQRIRVELSGNLCRCTGYAGIVKAALDAAQRLRAAGD
jgi:carbon-monoxide dehydrogenase small subunit